MSVVQKDKVERNKIITILEIRQPYRRRSLLALIDTLNADKRAPRGFIECFRLFLDDSIAQSTLEMLKSIDD